MPFPIIAAALVASSALMVAPYANEELKKKEIANSIDHLSATEIAYISGNHSNSLKLRANQLITRALLSKFSCR